MKSALSLVADSGFRVWLLTCDGTPTNFETLLLLGCSFTSNYDKMVMSFKHPTGPYTVYSILDACHMVKLARKTWVIMENSTLVLGMLSLRSI